MEAEVPVIGESHRPLNIDTARPTLWTGPVGYHDGNGGAVARVGLCLIRGRAREGRGKMLRSSMD